MKLESDFKDGTNKIRVKVLEISGETLKCRHLTSGFEVTAYLTSNVKIELGQVLLLEFRKTSYNYNGGYIVFDTLMEEMDAKVLNAQHIIADGMLYTSLILENVNTKQRLHSLVPSTDKLFSDTSVLIVGDTVKLSFKVNEDISKISGVTTIYNKGTTGAWK